MMSEDLAVDVGLTPDSPEFIKFVDKVDSILQYGCTSVTRVVQDIVDKCHTSELDIARTVILACASSTTSKRQSKLKWWETYQTPTHPRRRPRDQQQPRRPRDQQQRRHPHDQQQRRRPRDQQQSPKRRWSMSPLFQRQKRPRSPTEQRHASPRSDRYERPPEQTRSHKRRPCIFPLTDQTLVVVHTQIVQEEPTAETTDITTTSEETRSGLDPCHPCLIPTVMSRPGHKPKDVVNIDLWHGHQQKKKTKNNFNLIPSLLICVYYHHCLTRFPSFVTACVSIPVKL